MATPDPEGFSLLAKVIAAGSAFATPVVWLWTRLDKKADKHAVANSFQKVENEMAVHRGYFKDVFNQMRENEQRAQDRHERLMERINERGN